jgi:hypothetical protein
MALTMYMYLLNCFLHLNFLFITGGSFVFLENTIPDPKKVAKVSIVDFFILFC